MTNQQDTDRPWQESELRARREIAEQQLRMWQEVADKWLVYECSDEPRMPCRCHRCGQAVWLTCDKYGGRYEYTPEEKLALTVAHIRQVHETENLDE